MQNINNYLTKMEKLRRDYASPREAPVIAFMGPYNTGKSTLINNLLGQEISPVDVIPATSTYILFSYGRRFLARVYFASREVAVLTERELSRLLINKDFKEKKISRLEIQLDHELLKKMQLMDTPGIDAVTGPVDFPENLEEIDHIVYLFHQRGPGEVDRKAIQALLETKRPGDLSFWINCNLGQCDGSSLEEARQVLREICCGEIQVNLIDTAIQADVENFRLYLEEITGTWLITKLTEEFKELDKRIPEITEASLRESCDSLFLSKFWEAREYSRQVIQGQSIIKSIPLVSQEVKNLVAKPVTYTGIISNTPVIYKVNEAPNPAEIRNSFIDLIHQISSEPALQPFTKTVKELGLIAGKLEREKYLVTAAGGFSSGKTTFFNALMGEALLPAENRPTTFAITRIVHGSKKKAVIKYAQQVVIPTHFKEDNQVLICRHELAILERWLIDPDLIKEIKMLKKIQKGIATEIAAQELLQEIEQLKQTFARVKREFKGARRPWKTLFKKIPLRKFNGTNLTDYFEVYFNRADNVELNLNQESDRIALAKLAGSYLALRVELIEITHPAIIFKTADFVDSPGLDSVYHRHREITNHYLPSSDCFLIFLNGKSVLTKPDMGVIECITKLLDKAELGRKIFIIVNFADTLNAREKEKVLNYLKTNLNPVLSYRIHFISALEALKGREIIRFGHLVNQLKEQIWQSRRQDNFISYLNEAQRTLNSLIQVDEPITPAGETDCLKLLNATREKFSLWRERINTFATMEDVIGFRDGKKTVKKGFLGLSRRHKAVPSYLDLADDINTNLKSLKPVLPQPPELDVQSFKKCLDLLTGNKKTGIEKARQSILNLLNENEERICDALNHAIMQLKDLQSNKLRPEQQAGNGITNPELTATINKYLSELRMFEKNILTPGGSSDGKRQSVG
ncbi:dynamin family protein [Desulfotruncus alcoholivorax]|uniref:dynamin family protein n=1 Tax=Desulfotruncus alcoholivorax TaxID=265477 RepID=UPI0004209284|nr:dynamin family protein [Desulfotruncus alcoholivorax]